MEAIYAPAFSHVFPDEDPLTIVIVHFIGNTWSKFSEAMGATVKEFLLDIVFSTLSMIIWVFILLNWEEYDFGWEFYGLGFLVLLTVMTLRRRSSV